MHRKATTLMEVLIAIFVMGIGLLAILAMFPLGAMTMARAIRDDRTAHAVANAKAIGISMNLRWDPTIAPYFNNPGGGYADAPLDGPSHAVLVDPIGANGYSGADRAYVGGQPGGIIRATPSFVGNNASAMLRWCTLTDDITFGNNGQPSLDSGAIERAPNTSWAWLLRRPKAGDSSCCEMTVIVYTRRPLNTAVQIASKEVAYPNCACNPAQPNIVTVRWGANQPMPKLKEGGWIMDATAGKQQGTGKILPGSARFYRVVKVGDIVGGAGMSSVEIELAKPLVLRGDNPDPTIVVLEGVADVLECGTGWNPGRNDQ